MKIEIDLSKCKRQGLRPDQYVILYILYYKEVDLVKSLFTLTEAIFLRDSLMDTKYILDKTPGKKFFETIISKNHVAKLLDIREDKINFAQFYTAYPIRMGSRVFRAKSIDTVQGQKHQKKYLDKVKTIEAHKEAVAAVEAYVEKQRIVGKLGYLPAMETVLNNALWESWSELIVESGQEGANWQTDSI